MKGHTIELAGLLVLFITLGTSSAMAQTPWWENYDFASKGAVGFWPFDGDSDDKTGNGNNGMWTAGGQFVSGRFGQAYSMSPGVYFTVSSPTILSEIHSVSLVAYFKSNIIVPGAESIVGRGIHGVFFPHLALFPVDRVHLGGIPGLAFSAHSSTGPVGTSQAEAEEVFDGDWHLLVATWDGLVSKVYVDGNLIDQNLNADAGPIIPLSSEPLYINRHNWCCGWSSRLTGEVDEVVVFDRALSQTEVILLTQDNNLDGVADFWIPAAPMSQQEKIVYHSNKNGDYDIWMINADGTDPEILIGGADDQRAPKISPDGTKVSYSVDAEFYYYDTLTSTSHLVHSSGVGLYNWWPDSSKWMMTFPPGCAGDLVLFELDGTNSTLLSDSNELRAWGVSSNEIAYYSHNPCNSPHQVIKAFNAATGSITVIQPADGRAENGGTLSDDGNWLLYPKSNSGFSQPFYLHSMGSDGTGEERVVFSGPAISDEWPDWAPDNDQFVFSRAISQTQTDLRIGDRSGGPDMAILSDGFHNNLPNWGFLLLPSNNLSPSAVAGPNQSVEEGDMVFLDGTSSSDPDGDTLTYLWNQIGGPDVGVDGTTSANFSFDAPGVQADGQELVFRLTVSDNDSVNPLSAADEVIVEVRNINAPPSCDAAVASVPTLWPPDHKMRQVDILGVVDPDPANDVLDLEIISVTQDEPVDGVADGNTSPDAVIQAGAAFDSVLIRAERSGNGNGRVYRVNFIASDGLESCSGSIEVETPHSQSSAAVNDGQVYDSTL